MRRRLGVTPQESGFPDMLRVEEILTFVAAHYASPAPLARRSRDSDSRFSQSAAPERSPAASRAGSRFAGLCG